MSSLGALPTVLHHPNHIKHPSALLCFSSLTILYVCGFSFFLLHCAFQHTCTMSLSFQPILSTTPSVFPMCASQMPHSHTVNTGKKERKKERCEWLWGTKVAILCSITSRETQSLSGCNRGGNTCLS